MSPAMPRKTVHIVHTRLWKDRRVNKRYSPARPSPVAARSHVYTTLSCGCRTNNAGLAAWCVLHSEQVRSEEPSSSSSSLSSSSSSLSSLSSSSSPAGHDAGEADEVSRTPVDARSASQNEMMLHFGQGMACPLSQAFDCVGVTDSEREYLYRRLCEGVKEQQHGARKQNQLGELPSTADEDEREDGEKDRQFRDWVWQEFSDWVEFMYPDESRSAQTGRT